jgi:hypothetical protein
MSYFDQEGNPITHDQWLDIYAKIDERRLGKTQMGRFYISTVWLGLNYRYNPGPPLIFETMIFDSEKNHSDIGCQRYSTKLEALAGHIDAIEWVQKTNGEGYWPE